MKKKKEKSLRFLIRLLARVGIVSLPAGFTLIILVLFQEISWTTALMSFLGVCLIATLVVLSVFQELERFISYLKSLAQGIEIEPPRFKKGVFSSFRLADTFQSVKKKWFEQTLSDARILEHLPDPLIMIDRENKIVFENQKAKSIFGAKIIKKPSTTLFGEEPVAKAIHSILSEKTAVEWFDWGWEGLRFQVRIDRLPAETRNGAIAVITMNDITPFQRFREQQAEFFANASHELKTPLSINTTGFCHLMLLLGVMYSACGSEKSS